MRETGPGSKSSFRLQYRAKSLPNEEIFHLDPQRSQPMNQLRKSYRVLVLRALYAMWCSAILLFAAGGQTAQAQQHLLTHHMRAATRTGEAKPIGQLPPDQILSLDIVLKLRDQAGLDSFLKELYDPASPSYRHFLTVPEFTERFGPTQQDYDAVIRFARSYGLEVVGGSRDGMDVQVRGSVSAVETAFHVAMGTYQH